MKASQYRYVSYVSYPDHKFRTLYRIIPSLFGKRLQDLSEGGQVREHNPLGRKSVPYRSISPLFGERLQYLSEGGQVHEHNPPMPKSVPYRIIPPLLGECLQAAGT